jgi:hypothetical protein
MDFTMAERSFVRCSDYFGIQLVKQLRSMPDKMKAKAEIAMYFQRYDEVSWIIIVNQSLRLIGANFRRRTFTERSTEKTWRFRAADALVITSEWFRYFCEP